MMICSFKVAPMPPYALGQCGAIQPFPDSVRYQGISSAGGGRAVRPRNATGRFASSQVRTFMRNSASAGVSRRNMVMEFSVPMRTKVRRRLGGRAREVSFHLDVRRLHDCGPLRALRCEHLVEILRGANLDLGAERVKPRAGLSGGECLVACAVALADDVGWGSS